MAKATKCRFCQASIEFFFSPFTGKARKFEAKPVDPRTHQGPPAFPVEGRRAWKPYELAVDLQARRECSAVEAESEVRDMPWHVFHECPAYPHNAATPPNEGDDA